MNAPRWLMLLGACVVAVLLTRALVQPAKAPVRKDVVPVAKLEAEEGTRTNRRASGSRATAVDPPSRSGRRATIQQTTRTRTAQRPLVGFVIDDFRGWTTIPAGYFAEGITVANGALSLSDSASTVPRTGQLASPPLELWQPALAAPAGTATQLPKNAEVHTEIALSQDGITWGNWMSTQWHQAPDGRQAQPNTVPSWTGTTRPPSQQLSTDTTQTSGPYIKYRLTLTSQSGAAPVVQDLRIWRNPAL